MLYTSYWGNIGRIERAGIEPVAVSRGKPKGFSGRSFDEVAPTWSMVKMGMGPEYEAMYQRILARQDPRDFAWRVIAGRPKDVEHVAMLCWERDWDDCHRKMIAEWLTAAGIPCVELTPDRLEGAMMGMGTLF